MLISVTGIIGVCLSTFQGVPNSTITRRQKPRRVDLYYSSCCIRAGSQFDLLVLETDSMVLAGCH